MNLDTINIVAAYNSFKDVIDMCVYTLPCKHVFVERSKLSVLLLKYDRDNLETCDTVHAVTMRPIKRFRKKENSAVVIRTYLALRFVLKQKFDEMELDENLRTFVDSLDTTYKATQRKLFAEYVPDDPTVEFDQDGFIIRFINTIETFLLRVLQLSKLLKLRAEGDHEAVKVFQGQVTSGDLDTDKYFTRTIVTDMTDDMEKELLKTNTHRNNVIASIAKLRGESNSIPDSSKERTPEDPDDKLDDLVESVGCITISNP